MPTYFNSNDFGKNILLEEVERIFYSFLIYNINLSKTFIKKFDNFCFLKQLRLIKLSEATVLYIDFEYILYFSEELADLIEDQYIRIETSLKKSVDEIFKNIISENGSKKKILRYFRIGFYNLPNWKNFRTLKNYNYGRLICTIGNIVRILQPEPKLIFGIFSCSNIKCKSKVKLAQEFNKYSEPKLCSMCKASNSWELITEESLFVEIQKIRIQENFKKKITTSPFLLLDAFLVDDATNLFSIGNRCVFTGCLVPIPFNKVNLIAKHLNLKFIEENLSLGIEVGALYNPIFLVNHVFCMRIDIDSKVLKKNNGFFLKKLNHFFIKQRGGKIFKLKKWTLFFKKIESFFLYSFLKFENLRLGILLMLIGGVDKKISKKQVFRGNINISILYSHESRFKNLFRELKYLKPDTSYINGLTSSPMGLIASVFKDFETNSFCIESGLFTNKNNNLYFVENFHNLNYKYQKLITDHMDKQEFRINKADLNLKLRSKISVLGISEIQRKDVNQLSSFFNSIPYSKNLVKKFDLQYYYFGESTIDDDFFNSKKDISMNNMKWKNRKETLWSTQIYLSFIRNLSPIISKKGYVFILKIYLFLKKFSIGEKYQGFDIFSRHLETLIRLSEAVGKLLLSSSIQEFHIKAAGRIIFKSMYFIKPFEIKEQKNKYQLKKNNHLFGTKTYSQKIVIKFFDFNCMAKKLSLILKNNSNNLVFGISFLTLIKSFFFYFSKYQKNDIGLLKIKKIITILKQLIYNNKRFFITKLSKKFGNFGNCFILNKK